MFYQLLILAIIGFVSYWVYKNYNTIKTQHLIIGGSVVALLVYFFYDQIMGMVSGEDVDLDFLGSGYDDENLYGGGELINELDLDMDDYY